MSGRDLELRADVVRVSGEGAYAPLGWQLDGLYEIGYFLLNGREDVALVKHRFDQGTFAPLFWEHPTVTDRPMTTNLTRLEMDVDNFGMRQTREVTENDFTPLVYTNAQRQPLAYRLFIPAQVALK